MILWFLLIKPCAVFSSTFNSSSSVLNIIIKENGHNTNATTQNTHFISGAKNVTIVVEMRSTWRKNLTLITTFSSNFIPSLDNSWYNLKLILLNILNDPRTNIVFKQKIREIFPLKLYETDCCINFYLYTWQKLVPYWNKKRKHV